MRSISKSTWNSVTLHTYSYQCWYSHHIEELFLNSVYFSKLNSSGAEITQDLLLGRRVLKPNLERKYWKTRMGTEPRYPVGKQQKINDCLITSKQSALASPREFWRPRPIQLTTRHFFPAFFPLEGFLQYLASRSAMSELNPFSLDFCLCCGKREWQITFNQESSNFFYFKCKTKP